MPLLDILRDIIAPVFLLILTGYLFEAHFHFDLRVLSKTLLYLVMPATILTTLATSPLSAGFIRTTVVFCLAMLIGLFAVSVVFSYLIGHERKMARAFNLSVMFYNSGNYGFPVSDLAFPGLGMAIQAIVLAVQNVVNFTFGLFLVSSGRFPIRQAAWKTLKMPLVYAVGLAGVLRYFHVDIPGVLWLPLSYLRQALIPMALLTLGFQLAKTSFRREFVSSASSAVCRLLLSPLMALGLVGLLDIQSQLASILVLSTSYPTAINTALIAIELDNEPEFASNAVFLSTLCSAITVAAAIYLVKR